MHEPALLQSKLTFHVAFQFHIFRPLFENSFRDGEIYLRVPSAGSKGLANREGDLFEAGG